MIYFDNAASSHPKPPEVLRAVLRQLRENGANPGRSGHGMAMEAAQTVFLARQTVAKAFGTETEQVIFTANTTDAINRALKGILTEGDHAVISDLEHNSVLRPLEALRERIGVSYTVVKTEASSAETVENFRNALRPETKLVFCTHASNVTGELLPITEIGALCREREILFGADGAQTAGTEAYDLQKDPIDFLCIPGHKGLLGPQGTGALILKNPLQLQTLTEGGTGADSLSERQPLTLPEGYESGTGNTPGIAGLKEGVLFIERHRDAIRRHEQNLRNLFLEELQKIPFYEPLRDDRPAEGTVSLICPRGHSEDLARFLDQHGVCVRGGYHCSALAHKTLGTTVFGAVRFSFGYRNTEKEVLECIKYLKKYQNNAVNS